MINEKIVKCMRSVTSFKGILYAIISSATFGLVPLFAIPAIQEGVSVNTVVFLRFFISFIAMGIVLLFRRISFKVTKDEYKTLCWVAMLYAATSMLLTLSYLYIPSGTATTIHFLYPVLVTLIMIFLFKEHGNWLVYTATGLAVAGVGLLGNSAEEGHVNTTGLTLALITVCTYATYIVSVQKSSIHRMDGLKMTFYVLLNCAMIFFVNVWLQDGGFSPIPSWSAGIHLLLLALIPTLISDLTLILAVQKVGPTTTAILGCMEPVTAVVMGICFLQETCKPMQVLGIFVVLVAVTMAIIGKASEASRT